MKNKTKKEILDKIDRLKIFANRHLGGCNFVAGELKEIKQLLEQPEEEKKGFVKGQIVKDGDEYIRYNNIVKLQIKNRIRNVEPLDFPTLARTIAYNIPEAKKAILDCEDEITFQDENMKTLGDNNGNCIFIPFPNPSRIRQEIDIIRDGE